MRYRVIEAAVQFGPGIVLGLTAEQAAARRHRLMPAADGFTVAEPVEFKVGEVVEVLAGDVGKGLADRLVPADQPVPERPVAASAPRRTAR